MSNAETHFQKAFDLWPSEENRNNLETIKKLSKPRQENVSKTNLAESEVLRIAEATVKSEGYDVDKYNRTGCHYEFIHKDHTWTVFYELKPPTPPGGHFMISIDDQTKKAKLVHGE